MNNSNSREFIKIGLILFAITAVSAMLLAIVNQVTAPIIAENQLKKTYASMESVMSEADCFEAVETAQDGLILEAYNAFGNSGEKIGMCVITAVNGYGGEVRVLIGVSDGKVTGVDILKHSETPGLGAKAVDKEFRGQFEGKAENIMVSKGTTAENENAIDAISGATITSKAVVKAVNEAVKFAAEVYE